MWNFNFAKFTFEIYLKKPAIGISEKEKERSCKVSRREEIEESRAKPFTSNATFLLFDQLIKPIEPTKQVGHTSLYLVAIMPELFIYPTGCRWSVKADLNFKLLFDRCFRSHSQLSQDYLIERSRGLNVIGESILAVYVERQ